MEREFTLTRILDAPRDLVFESWTDPAQLDWFHSGNGEVTQSPQVDLRVGGEWRQQMIIDEETSYVTGGIYLEITPPERLVYRFGAVGGWPDLTAGLHDALLVTLEFNAVPGGAEMVCHLEVPAHVSYAKAKEWFDLGIEGGWTHTVDRLRFD